MNQYIPVTAIIVAIGLLAIGLYCLLITRNLIKIVVALQIVVKGVLVALIYAGYTNGQINLSQSMALTVIVVDTIVAVLGLALAVQIRRHQGTLDIKSLSSLKR